MAKSCSKSTFLACFDLNSVWKPFCMKLFYEMFLVYQIFNIFNRHCALFYQVMSPFRGSCFVKMAKSYSRSTFIACFDLIMSGNLFCIKLFYEMFLVYQIFNIFNCHCALFDQVMSPFRGSCCVKMAKSYPRTTFLACFDLVMSVFF